MDPDHGLSPDTGELSLATEVEAHVITITVRGELDAVTAMELSSRLTELLAEAAGKRILVDVQHLEHFGSAGIAVLVQAHRRAASQGIPFRVITGDNAIVTRPLATMKLDSVLRLYPTRANALA